ncbi:hypothetical protein AR457_32055 [Streptomyces agglomeratus]|uniref:Uncharacterized protein n=1 Tax=Streptomyces agglomeratus TaxID=285458 RepID=A0A1E5PFW5_9ACTN|nr:hypothetical protein [Streptomyces agglomeratus]OEJ28417.1 hypothetical protein AS594_31960 [Streptomyces agglomeratus]OEJ37520.1 hypothetical protein BGK70_04590 [Streptomyces agglomeratus]OEJ48095.1 hypothetical protein AR457_32055 [Streptomyces agglomeratus]OEJ50061.1 hypothetical protein BGK72_04105 [Streptomyces agglomeratus]
MNERVESMMQGLPDGGAELSVVLTLRWDDVAALGREASRLAAQRGAPVTLDEAASHRLRTWSSVANAPDERKSAAPPSGHPATAAITGTPAVERPRPHVGHLSETAPVASIPQHAAQPAQTPVGAAGSR